MDREPVGYIVHTVNAADRSKEKAVGKGYYKDINEAIDACYKTLNLSDHNPYYSSAPIPMDSNSDGLALTVISEDGKQDAFVILKVYEE